MEFYLIVPTITGVVQVLKKTFLPERYVKLTSLILGVIAVTGYVGSITFYNVLIGLVMGLAAQGMWDSSKYPIEKGSQYLSRIGIR